MMQFRSFSKFSTVILLLACLVISTDTIDMTGKFPTPCRSRFQNGSMMPNDGCLKITKDHAIEVCGKDIGVKNVTGAECQELKVVNGPVFVCMVSLETNAPSLQYSVKCDNTQGLGIAPTFKTDCICDSRSKPAPPSPPDYYNYDDDDEE